MASLSGWQSRALTSVAFVMLLMLLRPYSLTAQPVQISRVHSSMESMEAAASAGPIDQSSGSSCDSIWDGALFGVLPGILVGEVYGFVHVGCGETESHGCGRYLLGGATLGATVGAILDWRHCKSPEDQDKKNRVRVSLFSNPELLLVGLEGHRDSAPTNPLSLDTP